VSKGVPPHKLIIGLATYGRSFTLSGADTDIGAPASGAGPAGTFTREAGFMAYYEVCSCTCFHFNCTVNYELNISTYVKLYGIL